VAGSGGKNRDFLSGHPSEQAREDLEEKKKKGREREGRKGLQENLGLAQGRNGGDK